MAYVIGVDVGGTFTDAVLDDDAGTVLAAKSPSTPPDYSRGVLDVLRLLAELERVRASAEASVAPGTPDASIAAQEADRLHGASLAAACAVCAAERAPLGVPASVLRRAADLAQGMVTRPLCSQVMTRV